MKGKRQMKRILLTLATAAVLTVGSAALLAGGAGAANPHGDKAQPNGTDASCGGNGGGGNPGGTCNDPGLTQSNGCNSSSSAHNPHCTVQVTGITSAPTSPPAVPTTPGNQAGQGQAGKNAQGVAGQEAAGGGTAGRAATAANPAQTIDQLPFTGLETLWLALSGVGMLALGLVLRARSSSPAEAADTAPSSPDLSGESVEPRLRDPGMATVPDLRIATVVRRTVPGVLLPLSEIETLGLPLIGVRHARLRAGPGDAIARLRAGPGGAPVVALGAT
jgi:hypothetical protein